MKIKLFLSLFSLLIILESCSKDGDTSPQEENFYIEFIFDGSEYNVSNQEYQMGLGGGRKLCASDDGYISGHQTISLRDPKYESYIHWVSFSLTKKVFKDELNLSDESSYMTHVLNAENYGFPTILNGYYSVFDLENENFVVSRDVSAEGYLSIVTKEEKVYHSTSVVPHKRDKSSYLIIDKVIENKEVNNNSYGYVVEGRLKVDLVDRDSGIDTKILEGSFRWPIKEIHNSDLLLLCK